MIGKNYLLEKLVLLRHLFSNIHIALLRKEGSMEQYILTTAIYLSFNL